MREVFLSDVEILDRMPAKEEFIDLAGKPIYLIDPRLIDFLVRRGFDFNRPIRSRYVDALKGIVFMQEDHIIGPDPRFVLKDFSNAIPSY